MTKEQLRQAQREDGCKTVKDLAEWYKRNKNV